MIFCNAAYAQYPGNYTNRPAEQASQIGPSDSPASRSGYSHSAIAAGKLFEDGFDDMIDYKFAWTADGLYRKPQAIELVDQHSALVCTKNTGEFFLLDLDTELLSCLYQADGRSWTRLLKISNTIYASVDIAQDQIVIFQLAENEVRILTSLQVPGFPHSIAWDATERHLYVTGQWSQRLYDFAAGANWSDWRLDAVVDLPIHGGALTIAPKDGSMLICDAFSGDYVVLRNPLPGDPLQIVHHSKLYAHNIPAVVLSDDQQWVVLPFQLINPEIQSIQGNITWGSVISNNLRWLDAARMFNLSGEQITKGSKILPLGEVNNGAGDPTSLVFGSRGTSAGSIMAITLGGMDRVSVGRVGERELIQYDTGLHPVDALIAPEDDRIFVVNEFSDSLTRIRLSDGQSAEISLGQRREPTLAERGERLFFHAKLSHDGWMSCHSCHSQGHTNGQLNDNSSDGSFGSPKRVLSLLGQADTAPYGWTGEMATLEEQILSSLQFTMATDHAISPPVVNALAAYVRSLPAPPSLAQSRRLTKDYSERLADGRHLFERLSCNQCHAGATLTSPDRFDVELADERGQRLFNPPSLLGLSQRSRSLLHDGRASSIAELLVQVRHQITTELSSEEVELLVDYLSSL